MSTQNFYYERAKRANNKVLSSGSEAGSYYERAKRANIKVLEERSDERFLLWASKASK